jgi:hypothetical protein
MVLWELPKITGAHACLRAGEEVIPKYAASRYAMNPSGSVGNQRLLGEAEGEGAVEAGAEGEGLVGEQLLGGALPPALVPPGRRRLGGGEGLPHRVLAGGSTATDEHGGEAKRNPSVLLRQRCGGWVGLGRAGAKRQAVPFPSMEPKQFPNLARRPVLSSTYN